MDSKNHVKTEPGVRSDEQPFELSSMNEIDIKTEPEDHNDGIIKSTSEKTDYIKTEKKNTNSQVIFTSLHIADSPLATITSPTPTSSETPHFLKEVEGQKRITRKRCTLCYKSMTTEKGSAYARKNSKKINTICIKCMIPVCLECFQNKHMNVK